MTWRPPREQGEPVPVQVERQLIRRFETDPPTTVPREISAEAWVEYHEQYPGQSHERMLERGGFGILELASFLFQRIKRLEHEALEVSIRFGICRRCGRGTGIAITAEGLCKGCHSEAHP